VKIVKCCKVKFIKIMSKLKLHLPRFDGKPSSDFTLWQIRLQAILESKSLWHVFESTTSSPSEASSATNSTTQPTISTDFVMQITEEEKRKATAIIINGIGDKPIRVVCGGIHEQPQTHAAKVARTICVIKLVHTHVANG
jgi:hypothetical protein